MVSEEKMKIVINNYFKKECSVNTSIREAFEKGFRIGVSKVQKKQGEWLDYSNEGYVECPFCQSATTCEDNKDELHYCFNCGAKLN